MTQELLALEIKYEPHDKQWAFHQGRYDWKYRAAFAGTGGGKTICGLAEGLVWSCENEGSVGYVFEPTYKMVRRTLIPTLENSRLLGRPLIANPYVKDYRMGDNRIDFVNGSVLWFGSLEDPQMAEGPNIDWIMVDEAQYVRHFDEAWEVILRRLRGSGRSKTNRQGAWVTTTPPALLPGDRLYEFFEDADTRNPNSKVYRWSVHDNKDNLPKGYIEDLVRSHTGSLAKRFIEGKFAPAGTGSFDYDSQIHEVENTDRIHFNKIIYGVDFGWTNPSAIVAVGFDGDGRAYVLDEFYQNRTQMEVLISEAKLMRQQWGAGLFVCDRSEPQAIDSFRRAGLNAVADESKRDDGIHELGGRFQVSGDGKPRIYVRSTCVNWIHEVMVYSAEVKENDHAVDATRYAIMAGKKYGAKNAWVFG
jgi:phage terminase large subunit